MLMVSKTLTTFAIRPKEVDVGDPAARAASDRVKSGTDEWKSKKKKLKKWTKEAKKWIQRTYNVSILFNNIKSY